MADAFNGKGIPPLPGMKRVHIMKVNSGTWEEYVWLFVYLCAVAGIIYFVRFSV